MIPATFSIADVPFILNFSSPEFDKVVIFLVAVLLSITVNAEAQAFMATVLGDIRQDAKDRFHFNPIFHINLAGLICFLAAGFGWSKQIELNTDKFKHPAIAVIMVKFTGAFANLLLASIAGSILFIMQKWNLEDQVFQIVVSVNIMVFVYNFIPIPPLAGASLISAFLPAKLKIPSQDSSQASNTINSDRDKTSASASYWQKYALKIFPYIFVGAVILMRINGWTFFNDKLNIVVRTIFQFIAG